MSSSEVKTADAAESLRLSVSKTATFKGCKAKYKFGYILKLPRKERDYHTFGKFCHRVLELFHLAYINGETTGYATVMGRCFNESVQEFKTTLTVEQKDAAYVIIKQYLDRVTKNKDEVASVKSVEEIFNVRMNDGLTLTGMIDRVQLDPDGVWHVLDYKTSKSKTYLKDDTLQLLTYAYVVYINNPDLQKVRVSYIMLRHNCEFMTKEFSLKEILSVRDIYEQYAEQIHSETEYNPNPTRLCSHCDYVEFCPAGKAEVQKQYKIGPIKYGR